MLNIKYKGKYKNEEQLKEGFEPQPYSGIYEEIPKKRLILLHYLVPLSALFIAAAISITYQIRSTMNMKFANDFIAFINYKGSIPLFSVLTLSILLILSYIHELIHCIFYPIKAEKQIYSRLPYGLMVHCGEQISKGRFILMVLAPSILLGFIPFILCSLFIWRVNPLLSIYCTMLSVGMLGSGCSDFTSAYKTITQVPNGAKVFNYGIETYWIKD